MSFYGQSVLTSEGSDTYILPFFKVVPIVTITHLMGPRCVDVTTLLSGDVSLPCVLYFKATRGTGDSSTRSRIDIISFLLGVVVAAGGSGVMTNATGRYWPSFSTLDLSLAPDLNYHGVRGPG